MPVIALVPKAETKTQKMVGAAHLSVPTRIDQSRMQQADHSN